MDSRPQRRQEAGYRSGNLGQGHAGLCGQKPDWLANNWLSQDEESARDPETAPITEEEFTQRILLTEVSVSPGGRFTAYYNDDDMFWGHSVEVSGSLKKGITYANLAG